MNALRFSIPASALGFTRHRILSLCICLSLGLILAACTRTPPGKRYELDGRVVAVDSAGHELTVAHGDIPGLMSAMTMPFLVGKDEEWIFGKIGPGDHIHATLVISDHAELQDISFTKASDTAGDGTSNLRIPEPGDEVPDLVFENQSGRSIRFSQFRGKPLLLTFIYTLCPLPDYCPRMSSNFRQVLQQLHTNPAWFAEAQLLSISIDPERDKPSVLRNYGAHYSATLDPGFKHWQFVTGTPEEIRKAADFFGLSYNQKEGQIVHALRTVLIAPDGKIVKVYPGNQWKPEEVARDFAAAIGQQ